MFGYVMTNREALSEEERKRFGAYYCGLCHSLGSRHGSIGRLSLSFEMTFLAMLLSSLYEPETESGSSRCILHPKGRHDYLENPCIDYAADMTVVLAYHKAMDDWKDDRSLRAKSQARMLHSRYKRIEALYPRQLKVVSDCMAQLDRLEKANCMSIDALVNAFGELLGELFVFKKDLWSDSLRQIGASMGRFIYLMDAYDDLESDKKKGRFNPLIPISSQPDFEECTHRNLTLLLGEGTVAFERLPLVQDLGILRNVLYSGIWTRYQMIQRKRHGEEANG